MSLLGFDHIAIPITDVNGARELFGNVFGLPLIAAHSGPDWGGKPWLMMIYGLPEGRHVALCALAGDEPVRKSALDLPHYTFAVRTRVTLKSCRKKLVAAGYVVRDEAHGHQQSIYFEDASGTTWEITAPPSRNRTDKSAASVVGAWLEQHQK
jgi:catechol 2,3-dioxygenase-like lactoylglutathione lyase family enzyme